MLHAKDIMSTDMVTLTPEMSLRDAMEMMSRHRVSGAPVLSGERVVGVLSTTDIMDFLAALPGVPMERDEAVDVGEEPAEGTSEWREDEPVPAFFIDMWSDAGAQVDERMRSADSPEWNVLEEHTVQEAMNMHVVSLPPSASVEEVASFMRKAEVRRVLILDDDRLKGVVSTDSIAGAVADYGLQGDRER